MSTRYARVATSVICSVDLSRAKVRMSMYLGVQSVSTNGKDLVTTYDDACEVDILI
jgi:hypothetical protein